MTISETLLPEFDVEIENTRKLLSAVPEGKWDWKPHPKSMSVGQLAGHIADMTSWAVDVMGKDSLTIAPGDFKPYVPESIDDLLSTFQEKRTSAREAIAKASDADMAHVWSMTWAGQKIIEMPRIAVLRGMVMNHIIHHRGQLTVYMRLLDAKVPGLYGPSADEMGGA
ncbi:MAG: DinB family protein [Bryobacteraceae bacterium]